MRIRLLRWFFDKLMALLTDRRIEGMENVPPQGPYIMVVNHLSVVDVPLLYVQLGGEHVTGWAAEKYRRHPLFAPLVRLGGGVFIRRGEVDREALEKAVAWLKTGKVFGISPEGTRSKTGGLLRAKTGVAYLAHMAGSPILPVAITGTEKAFRTLLRLRRPRLTMRIGEPFELPPLDENGRNASLRRNTDEIMCRIAALLPPGYRGVYADHPRLRELLAAEDDDDRLRSRSP